MHNRTPLRTVASALVTLFAATIALAAGPTTASKPATAPSTATATASAPAAPTPTPGPRTVPLSFTNAPLRQIADFLAKELGKPVLIKKEVESTQVTLVNPKPLPPDEALSILTTALNEVGVAIEERDQTIHLIPIAQVNQSRIKTYPAEADLATIKPRNQIIRKVFAIKYYDPGKLVDVIKPLLPAYGHVTADPTTGKLIIVANVDQLLTMSRMITELDQPDVTGGELGVFRLQHADVYEIIPMLEKLISGYLGVEVRSITSGGSGDMRGSMGSRGDVRPPDASGGPGAAGVVSIKGDKKPILIIPDPRRSSIVVAAPSSVLAQIKLWLATLDQPKPVTTKEEIVEVKSDVEELAKQLTDMLNSYPDESLRSALKIYPFPSSRRLMIAGSEQNRKLIKTWLAQIDIEDAGQQVTKTFKLEHADAQQVAENLKELFSDDSQSRRYRWWTSGGRQDRTNVSVTANVRNNSITVLTSPERMIKVEKQLQEWDKPFEGKEAEPKIYVLKYADPDKTKDLLESLFTKKDKSRNMPWWWDDGEEESTPAPVGRLYGQFRFEAYGDTGKLVVVTKNADNYKIIDDLIARIDLPQMAGMPRIIQLKFAEAESLAEQLNALLNAPGTPASILRRGLAKPFESFGGDQSPYYDNKNGNGGAQPQPPSTPGESDLTRMAFWWQTPPMEIKIKQPSNLIGKLRIVPNVEQNLLMICAPEEYAQAIEDYVRKLDQPGYRVLIQAVIATVTHDDMTSLGYRFSSDPSLFTTGANADITENALRGLLNYTWKDNFGKENTISLNVDVNNLISLLRRVTDLKINSQPKILAADNVEAEFFDGQDVPFISHVQTFDTGARTEDFTYFPVGIRLRVRPHITKDRNIDLTVNLLVSNLVPGVTLFGGAIVDRRETTTRVLLEDGRTFLISGILREEEHAIIRRVPGLGDIPGLGEVFKHREMAKVNSELLIFLTPYVICPKGPFNKIESEPLDAMETYMQTETQAERDMRCMKMESPFPPSQPAVCPPPKGHK